MTHTLQDPDGEDQIVYSGRDWVAGLHQGKVSRIAYTMAKKRMYKDPILKNELLSRYKLDWLAPDNKIRQSDYLTERALYFLTEGLRIDPTLKRYVLSKMKVELNTGELIAPISTFILPKERRRLEHQLEMKICDYLTSRNVEHSRQVHCKFRRVDIVTDWLVIEIKLALNTITYIRYVIGQVLSYSADYDYKTPCLIYKSSALNEAVQKIAFAARVKAI